MLLAATKCTFEIWSAVGGIGAALFVLIKLRGDSLRQRFIAWIVLMVFWSVIFVCCRSGNAHYTGEEEDPPDVWDRI